MKTKLALLCLLSAAVFSNGCVTHRTVTKDGKKVKSGYVVKRPFEKPGN